MLKLNCLCQWPCAGQEVALHSLQEQKDPAGSVSSPLQPGVLAQNHSGLVFHGLIRLAQVHVDTFILREFSVVLKKKYATLIL